VGDRVLSASQRGTFDAAEANSYGPTVFRNFQEFVSYLRDLQTFNGRDYAYSYAAVRSMSWRERDGSVRAYDHAFDFQELLL